MALRVRRWGGWWRRCLAWWTTALRRWSLRHGLWRCVDCVACAVARWRRLIVEPRPLPRPLPRRRAVDELAQMPSGVAAHPLRSILAARQPGGA